MVKTVYKTSIWSSLTPQSCCLTAEGSLLAPARLVMLTVVSVCLLDASTLVLLSRSQSCWRKRHTLTS